MEKIYKVCTNKGNKRIWIEGKILINAGLDCGLVFDKTITDDQIILNFDSSTPVLLGIFYNCFSTSGRL